MSGFRYPVGARYKCLLVANFVENRKKMKIFKIDQLLLFMV